ncbi:hypothetical protein ACIRRI_10650 [Streptomyces mirabilis]|uniref:hypothetical protein n=1 Tax=Streptomyces mirabilis TaxID=68239 RepID=UPI0037F90D26
MDASLAALIGALGGATVGSLGTVGTTWLSGRSAERQQSSQLQRQHRFEHLRERREPRSLAYAAFLAKGRELRRTVRRDVLADVSTAQLESHAKAIDELGRVGAQASIEGPAVIAPLVSAVEQAATATVALAMGLKYALATDDQDRKLQAMQNWSKNDEELALALTAFLNRARSVLDEFGDEPE